MHYFAFTLDFNLRVEYATDTEDVPSRKWLVDMQTQTGAG